MEPEQNRMLTKELPVDIRRRVSWFLTFCTAIVCILLSPFVPLYLTWPLLWTKTCCLYHIILPTQPSLSHTLSFTHTRTPGWVKPHRALVFPLSQEARSHWANSQLLWVQTSESWGWQLLDSTTLYNLQSKTSPFFKKKEKKRSILAIKETRVGKNSQQLAYQHLHGLIPLFA